jgi:aminoglycoside phosphotransferase (APT) family kinase protein
MSQTYGPSVPGLDLTRLRRYLAATEQVSLGPLQAFVIPGGRSNVTYDVTDGHRHLVVRRPPLGGVLPTAHDVAREARIMSALAQSAVPVPTVLHLCEDSSVIGAPFVVMEKVQGIVLRDQRDLQQHSPEALTEACHRLVDVLADLHAVTPGPALAGYGRPEGFLTRNVKRWQRQWVQSRTRELPTLDEVIERLLADPPQSQRATIVHGDYRLDNVMFAPGLEEVRAVLDWELSTLGDPLVDVGLLHTYADVSAAVMGMDAPGLLSGDEFVARYGERSTLDLARIDWYVAFGVVKLAVILEGVHARYLAGATVGEGFEHFGAHVPDLAQRAADALG